jgi:hypothetical protein
MKKRIALLGFLMLGQVSNLLGIVRVLWAVIFGGDAGHATAIAYDQLANAAFNGDPDETLSSRAGRKAREGNDAACKLCKWLDWFDKNHCEKSIERADKLN